MSKNFLVSLVVLIGLSYCISDSARATHPCTSPLVLDLDGDGFSTTGVEDPITFDINGDGLFETIGWTASYGNEGFLWVDQDGDGRVSDGGELFGTAFVMPSGAFAENGFEALGVYDRPNWGGNADGQIDQNDAIWNDLRLWVDGDHDGRSDPGEVHPIQASRVVGISLDYDLSDARDGHGNHLAFEGEYFFRSEAGLVVARRVVDIFFVIVN